MFQTTSLSSYILTKCKQGISGLLYLDQANPWSSVWTQKVFIPVWQGALKLVALHPGWGSQIPSLKKKEDDSIFSLVGQRLYMIKHKMTSI